MKLLLLFFVAISLMAQDNYSFRLAYGKVTDSNFGRVIMGDIKSYPYDLRVISLDGGYLLKKDLFDIPLDFYIKVGLSYFDENSLKDDTYESTLYFKAYYNFDFFKNRVRLGLGEGGSYTTNVLYAEKTEADRKNDNNSKYLNYIDLSLDFDLGKLIRVNALSQTYIGFALKHRSGIFGLINNVKHGGSNYPSFYLETNF